MMFRVAVAAAMLTLLSTLAIAQTDAGRISGTVRDGSNAFVAGATVKVTNSRTGETRTVLTDQNGVFFASPLRPSIYTVTAEKPGFATIEYPEMPVAVKKEGTVSVTDTEPLVNPVPPLLTVMV